MLNINIDWKKVEIEISGHIITAEVKPLTVTQMMDLAPYLSPKAKEDDTSMFKIQKAAAPHIDKIVRNIEGVQINGKPVDVKLLGIESCLAGVCVKLIVAAFTSALPSDKQSEGN